MYATPGAAHPETTDFLDANGKPVTMTIEFKDGVAEVPDNLGRFLIDTGVAKGSPIITLSFPELRFA
jgi:hypothetical protein